MHMIMALLQNICKFKGCAQTFQSLVDLIHHIEDTHIIAFIPLPERSQPACLPLSCILPYNPPCETVAPTAGASAGVKGVSDSGQRDKTGVSTVWASAPQPTGNATNNQPSEVTTGNSATATTATVNGSGHGLPGGAANGTSEQNGLSGVSGSTSESSKSSSLNQPSGTTDLKRKIAIKHHSYSISSSNRSTTPTGSELDDDDMMVSESEDSNDSWTTEEFSSEFIMRYGSRRHSSCGAGNGSNSSNEKPFACPVPGCKKRYKNVNGIKYHSKNGHKKDGNRVRKGFKCFCGKSYKTHQRLKIHNMLSHGPGWTNTTTAGATTSSSSGSAPVPAPAPAPASETDNSVTGFETISLASSVSLPAPAAPSQPTNARGASSNQNSNASLSSSWDSSSFSLDYITVESSGCGTILTSESDHHAPDQPSGQAERSLSSTSNSNGSSSSSNVSFGSGSSACGGGNASGVSNTGRSISCSTSIGSTVYPNNTRFSHIAGGSSTIASTPNGTNASITTTSPPPLPPPTPTLASPTTSGQSSFTIAAQTTAKRTASSAAPSTTTAATLVISSLPAAHGINSSGCFVSSTPISSPVSFKYDSLGILTPATSPKLIAASAGQDGGQQQLLAGAGGGPMPAVAVATPLPPAPPMAMPPLAGNVVGGTAAAVAPASSATVVATGAGDPVGIALVVSSIGGCSEMGSNSSASLTTTSSTINSAVASTATSQLYAEET